MEHAVLTREMISHATMHRKDMYMVQTDFSNAFGSDPHDLILSNMYSIGLQNATVELVRDICTANRSKICSDGRRDGLHPMAERARPSKCIIIIWQSGTVQGCPLSPTLFNICLEGFLCRLEKEDMKQLGYSIPLDDGTTVHVNTAATQKTLFLATSS
jgi:hypothetical protein